MEEYKLKYPVGSKILWCGDEFIVLENKNDYVGTVLQGDDIITNFRFTYGNEVAERIYNDCTTDFYVENMIEKMKKKRIEKLHSVE